MAITIPGVTGPNSTLNNPASAFGSAASAIPANMQISEAGFLQLISTQMQNQDPLNPADPSQFLQQIEGLSEVSSMQSMQTALQSSQLTNGSALIGKTVLAPSNTATLAAGGQVAGAVSAPAGATNLTVSITDSSGAPVTSFQVAPQSSGLTSFAWNGTGASGASAPAGQYNVAVTATVNGSGQSVAPFVQSTVTSVTLDPSSQALDVNTSNGTVPFSSVLSVL
ncbi:MAG: flagellar hook assembly protein FlgD [Steroidobacteraceae bacterium]